MSITLLDEPILKVMCDEPEYSVEREVRFMPFYRENLAQLWEQVRKHDTLFGTEIKDDFRKFIELVIYQYRSGEIEPKGLYWVVDDFIGVFYLTNIIAGVEAKVHYSFFDGRHRGRYELTKAMIRYVFNYYGFRRLTAEVPLYATKYAFSFVEGLGFRREGRKRKAAEYKGTLFDVKLYGLLRGEI